MMMCWKNIGAFFCKRNLHFYRMVAYGYPSESKVWTTVHKCKWCKRLTIQRDRSRDGARPTKYLLKDDYMMYRCVDGKFRLKQEITNAAKNFL